MKNIYFKMTINLIAISFIIFCILGYAKLIKANNLKNDEELLFEAEDAILNGLEIDNTETGYSGAGYVKSFGDENQSVTFTINNIPSESLYELQVGYGSIYGEGKVADVLVNEKLIGSFTMGSGFGEVSAGKIVLNEGANTVTITPNWTWFAIDYIKIIPITDESNYEIERKLINPQATETTKNLFNYLVDNFGHKILSGQQGNPGDNLADLEYIENLTGKLPAILGLDLMDYSPSRVEYGATTDVIERAIEWHNQGGIITLAWHWNAPKDLLDSDEQPWWSGFNTDATTFNIEFALNHPESEDYKLLIRDIDAIAIQLKRLQKVGASVIWRPLHEAEGGWFWWGAKGPEPVKELWKIMYDRLTNVHELNNLIWVWNSINEEWYPGNDYVDIVSFDSYPGNYNYGPQSAQYDALAVVSDYKKLIAMAENGPIPDPDTLSLYQSNYIYFTTWNGLLSEQNREDHIIKVFNHENVITLDELPAFDDDKSESNTETGVDAETEKGETGTGEDVDSEEEETGTEEDVDSEKGETGTEGEGDSRIEESETEKTVGHVKEVKENKTENNISPENELLDKKEEGNPLPNTATSMYEIFIFGFILMVIGIFFHIIFNRKRLE